MAEKRDVAEPKKELSPEELYHLGLNSLPVDDYFKLKLEGKIEEAGKNPTLEIYVEMVEKGKEIISQRTSQ